MHRDLKLGLALAVLLIGATTAFFFRSETEPNFGLPKLQNPERLDAEIAGRDLAPYLGELEAEPAGPESSDITESPWAKPAFLDGTTVPVRQTAVTPDPIRIILGGGPEEPISGPSLPPAPEPDLAPVAAAGERTHVVKPGDTLTSIAARYLGSTSRFGDVFDLNRDRLARPDDLRVGMTLRIPTTGPAAEPTRPESEKPATPPTSVATEKPSPPAVEEAAVIPPQSEKASETLPDAGKLFVPARRTPFVPSRYRAPGIPAAKAEEPAAADRK
jgi:hypothetical protein